MPLLAGIANLLIIKITDYIRFLNASCQIGVNYHVDGRKQRVCQSKLFMYGMHTLWLRTVSGSTAVFEKSKLMNLNNSLVMVSNTIGKNMNSL